MGPYTQGPRPVHSRPVHTNAGFLTLTMCGRVSLSCVFLVIIFILSAQVLAQRSDEDDDVCLVRIPIIILRLHSFHSTYLSIVCLQWKPTVNSFKRRFGLLRLPHSSKSPSGFHLEKRILICGDVESNPGPRNQVAAKFPCKQCGKAVRNNQDAILCEDCDT